MGLARGRSITDVVGSGTTENDDIQKRVGTETVRAMHRNASSFTSSVKTRDDLVFAISIDSDHLAGVLGRNTTH